MTNKPLNELLDSEGRFDGKLIREKVNEFKRQLVDGELDIDVKKKNPEPPKEKEEISTDKRFFLIEVTRDDTSNITNVKTNMTVEEQYYHLSLTLKALEHPAELSDIITMLSQVNNKLDSIKNKD